MEVPVRTLQGQCYSVSVEAGTTVKQLKQRLLQQAGFSSCQLLLRGAVVKDTELVSLLRLSGSEWLVAIFKAKRSRPPASVPAAQPAEASQAAGARAPSGTHEPGVPGVQRPAAAEGILPARHSAPAALSTLEAAPAASPGAQCADQACSPPPRPPRPPGSSPASPAAFTLLPGYTCRPHPSPSPQKPARAAPRAASSPASLPALAAGGSLATLAAARLAAEANPDAAEGGFVRGAGGSGFGPDGTARPPYARDQQLPRGPTGRRLWAGGGPDEAAAREAAAREAVPGASPGPASPGPPSGSALGVDNMQRNMARARRAAIARHSAAAAPASDGQAASASGDCVAAASQEALWRELADELQAAPISKTLVVDVSDSPSSEQAASESVQQPSHPAGELRSDAPVGSRRRAVAGSKPGQRSRFRGTGAVGLARKLLEQEALTPGEAAALERLPLPPVLERLLRIFQAVNLNYSFLIRNHIQATWRTLRQVVCDALPGDKPDFGDLEALARLCPRVVRLRSRASWAEPADPAPPPAGASPPDEEANPMAIATDGSGTVLQGERERFIVDLLDPLARAGGAAASRDQLQGLHTGGETGDMVPEPGSDARSLGVARSGARPSAPPSQTAVHNATQRRQRAFRQELAAATLAVHAQYLASAPQGQEQAAGGPEGDAASRPAPRRRTRREAAKESVGSSLSSAESVAGFDPVKEGRWHSGFDLDALTLPAVISAAAAAREAHLAQDTAACASAACAGSEAPPRPLSYMRRHEPCTSLQPMGTDAFLKHLQQLSWYSGQVVHEEHIPARQSRYAQPAHPLSPPVQAALAARGIHQLFTHQAQALDAVAAGAHVVVATSTASGKSLCYNLPVLQALAADAGACALFLFPTKALAQDQLRALRELTAAAFGPAAPHADVYDGDTAQAERGEVRERAQLLITNPDMLHRSVLPVHRQFRRILARLRYCVVDEGHAYRGVFGCHTALVLRRLRRVCEREYGRSPQFIVTSATIANPQQHVQQLLGVDNVVVVNEDGSPHGPKTFVLWNPPLTFRPARQDSAAGQDGSGAGAGPREDWRRMSHTEGRARRKHRNKRAVDEFMRSERREANQERARGTRLGPGAAGEEDWLAAARAGRKRSRAAAAGEALGTMEEADNNNAAVLELSSASEPEPEAGDSPSCTPGSAEGEQLGPRTRALIQLPPPPPPSRSSRAGLSAESMRQARAAVAGAVTFRPDNAGAQGGGTVDIQHHHERPLIRRQVSGLVIPGQPASAAQAPPGAAARAASAQQAPAQQQAGAGEADVVAAAADSAQARLPGRDWRERYGAAGTGHEDRRASPVVELSLLLAECVQHGLRTIAFCKTRKLCELVTAYTRETLKAAAPHLAHSIAVYRAGYSPQERREIERALFGGELAAVAATNALELGVDVGSLDVTLHLGFPGSVSSLWQQAGRAGRREQASASIYIAFDGPLDQWFMTRPAQLFGRPLEQAQVDPSNTQLLQQHAACAAAECVLLVDDDQRYFGAGLLDAAFRLVHAGLLARHPEAGQPGVLHYVGPQGVPAAAISLRAIDPERYAIVNEAAGGEVLEEIEESKAFYEVYDGAVYMYQGRTYLCKRLDLASKTAVVRPADLKYYTKTRDFCDVAVVGGHAAYPQQRPALPGLPATSARCAPAQVTVRWLGFHRIWQGSGEVFDTVDLFLPDVQFDTQAAYIRVPAAARQRVKAAGLPFRDGLHAASHALLNCLPLFLLCDAADLGTECDNPYDQRYRPERLLVYDKHPGGIGLAQQACPLFGLLLERALQLITSCPCAKDSGCPACVQHTDCSEYNAVLSKGAAIEVLRCTLESEREFRESQGRDSGQPS